MRLMSERMNIWKTISQALVLLLILIAAIVAGILISGNTAWEWIIIYWVTLTLKNISDFIGGMKHDI